MKWKNLLSGIDLEYLLINQKVLVSHILLLFISFSCDIDEGDKSKDLNFFFGTVELYDEFGNHLDESSKASIILESENKIFETISGIDGKFRIQWSDNIRKLMIVREGFGSRVFTNPNFDFFQGKVFRLSEISSMEIENFSIEQADCGYVPCYNLVFEAKNFFKPNISRRFFELEILKDSLIIENVRFFSLLESDLSHLDVEPLTETNAKISLEGLTIPALLEHSVGSKLRCSLYGATENDFHKDFGNFEQDASRNQSFKNLGLPYSGTEIR